MSVLKTANCLRNDCCPLCKSDDIFLVGEMSYGGKTIFSSVEIELDCKPELWKCHRCESAFAQNIIDAETARSLYSMGQAGERWLSNAFDKEKTTEAIRCMTEIFKCGGSVLDVGCNTGELLDFALGFGCKTSGVEFSSVSRDVLQQKRHHVYSALEDTPGGYSVITAFDVVEHLYDVPAFLEDCAGRLAEEGKLVIMTGDIDCLSAKITGKNWWYAQYPEHIVFPSRKFFSDYSGLRIKKWIPTYAAKSFECSMYKCGIEMLNSVLRGYPYTAYASPVPDHALIILKKLT